jgi:phosphoglycolate phosphatase-like HAD superfamily hydrolase
MANHGLSLDAAKLDDLRRRYVAHLADEIQLPGEGVKEVMPGVRPLLDRLRARPDVAVGLLTGNFEASARMKLA